MSEETVYNSSYTGAQIDGAVGNSIAIKALEIAANNGKVLAVENGSFTMADPATLIANGNSISY